MSCVMLPTVSGTLVLGVNTVVKPLWCTRPSGHSVCPAQSLVLGPSFCWPPAVMATNAAGALGGVDPGSLVLRTYGVNAFTSEAHSVLLRPSMIPVARTVRL